MFSKSKTAKLNRRKHKLSKWITIGIIRSINTNVRNDMYRKLRKTSPDSEDFQTRTTNLKTFNTILKRSIHTAKKQYYNSCFDKYKNNIKQTWSTINITIDSNKSYNHYLKNHTTATFHFEPTNSTTVTKIINELKTRHNTGPDGLSTKLLQYIKEPLIEAITITLNQSLNTGIFPEKLKIAKVIPIHKQEAQGP